MVDRMRQWDIKFNTALTRAEVPRDKPLDYVETYVRALSSMLGSLIGSGRNPDTLRGVTWYEFWMSYLNSPACDDVITWLKQRQDCAVLHNKVTGSFELGVLQV